MYQRKKVNPNAQLYNQYLQHIFQTLTKKKSSKYGHLLPKLGIGLANSMMKRTDAEHKINEWQKKSLPFGDSSTENGNEPDQLLGMTWWTNFLK